MVITIRYSTMPSRKVATQKKTSVSVGWNISEEPFFQNAAPVFDNLKIRGSWGRTGNDRIGAWQYMASYGFGGGYVFGEEVKSIFQTRTPNPNVTWEVANQLDIGLEGSLLDQILSETKLNPADEGCPVVDRLGVDAEDARGRMRVRGLDRQLPAEPGAGVDAHVLEHDGEELGGVAEGVVVVFVADTGAHCDAESAAGGLDAAEHRDVLGKPGAFRQIGLQRAEHVEGAACQHRQFARVSLTSSRIVMNSLRRMLLAASPAAVLLATSAISTE